MRTGLLRDPRLQSLAVIGIVAVGALAMVADTILLWRAESGALAILEERAGLLEQKAALVLAPKADAAASEASSGKILLNAHTSGLVSAEFQRLLSSRAEQVGAVVRTVDLPEADLLDTGVEPGSAQSVERIRLTADIEVMEQALPELLYAIEGGAPVMVIDAFTLRLNRKVDILGTDASASGGSDRPLSLSVTLSAFREKEPQS